MLAKVEIEKCFRGGLENSYLSKRENIIPPLKKGRRKKGKGREKSTSLLPAKRGDAGVHWTEKGFKR